MRIGILHARFLGDAILATPLIRSLVAARHEIVHLAPTPLRKIADLIPWGRWRFLAGEPPKRVQTEERFDALMLPATLDSQARWAWESGVSIRVGRPRPSARPWLTHAPLPRPGEHESSWILSLLEPLGIEPAVRQSAVVIPREAGEWAHGFLRDRNIVSGRFTLLCPFSNRVSSEWPLKSWEELSNRLGQIGESVIVDAPPGRADAASSLAAFSTNEKSTIAQFAALMALAHVTITIDSASMHLAAAIGRPTVALFGPTDPRMYGGYPPPFRAIAHPPSCGPCFRAPLSWPYTPETCPDPYACMNSITVEEVMDAWSAVA